MNIKNITVTTIVFCMLSISAICQYEWHSPIKAEYISITVSDSTHGGQFYWNKVHKMDGNNYALFTCEWLKNGDVKITTDGEDQVLNPVYNLHRQSLDTMPVPKSVNGFQLNGLYHDPRHPWDLIYAFYTNPRKANCLLQVVHIIGDNKHEVFAAGYYTDNPKDENPFENTTIVTKINSNVPVIIHDTATLVPVVDNRHR